VIRPVLTSARRSALPAPDTPLALPPVRLPNSVALTGEIQQDFDYGAFADVRSDVTGDTTEVTAEEDPAIRLRRLIEKRQAESIEILRSWMEHEEERA